MFQITQSNHTDILLDHLIKRYRDASQADSQTDGLLGLAVFKPFMVIVPSMVLGDWLNKAVADRIGISTLITTQFWGQYQWQMIQAVLKIDAAAHPHSALAVPEVAVLSGSVMRWRIFGYISTMPSDAVDGIMADESHPLHFLLAPLYDANTGQLPEHRVWQSAQELSAVYVRYLTHRPEWLHAWTMNAPLPMAVADMIQDKDKFADAFGAKDATPDWLVSQYEAIEQLLRHIWQVLFSDVYAYREALEERFWAVMDGVRGQAVRAAAIAALPDSLQLFTIQQIPQIELIFLKRLSTHIDIHLLHFNPSQMFWADIVDANWLATQKIIKPHAIYLKDHGHPLLSRLAKESRETFAMLADLSGGEFYYEKNNDAQAVDKSDSWTPSKDWQVVWVDDFKSTASMDDDLLTQLKNDILMLDDGSSTASWLGTNLASVLAKSKPMSQMKLDLSDEMGEGASQYKQAHYRLPSLSIHACHDTLRQLQIARIAIANYLNDTSADRPRSLSDVVVYLPDVQAAKHLIELSFNQGVGSDGLVIPAKITGVTDPAIDALFGVIQGFFAHVGTADARFYHEDIFEWLKTPALYESFGLDFDGVTRACDLLAQAGFRRGFDHKHIKAMLDEHDHDYRYTFSHALDRIVAGFLSPSSAGEPVDLIHPFDWRVDSFAEAVAPLAGVTLTDAAIVEMLCTVHSILDKQRNRYQQVMPCEYWLHVIEHELIHPYFSALNDSVAIRAIYEAMNSMAASIRANKQYQRHTHSSTTQPPQDIMLSLQFVLTSIEGLLQSQAVSAESSGVVTFARFGTLRSVPFGLTIMLEMNLSAFPRQSQQLRMDLMRAGLKRRGDRYNEDDDNGAFLDALLCTRDACMICYQGQSRDGTVKKLPATPVSELIEFFKSNVAWHLHTDSGDHDKDGLAVAVQKILPSLIEPYLVTEHSATPYEREVFYQTADEAHQAAASTDTDEISSLYRKLLANLRSQQAIWHYRLPPAPLWRAIRERLDDANDDTYSDIIDAAPDSLFKALADVLIALQYGADSHDKMAAFIDAWQISLAESMSIDTLFGIIRRPGQAFLAQKLATWRMTDEMEANEPRRLNHLDDYLVQSALIEAVAAGVYDGQDLANLTVHHLPDSLTAVARRAHAHVQALYYGDILPAGVVRIDSLAQALTDLMTLIAKLGDLDDNASTDTGVTQIQHLIKNQCYSQLITQTDSQILHLNIADMACQLTAKVPVNSDQWFNIVPNAAKDEYLLKMWLSHLAWQVLRGSTDDDVSAQKGVSIWQFSRANDSLDVLSAKTTKKQATLLRLAPMPAQVARSRLIGFILMASVMQHYGVPLTINSSLIVAMADLYGKTDELNAQQFKQWLSSGYNYTSDQSSEHPDWQLLLGSEDAYQAMMRASITAAPLYAGLIDALMLLDGESLK